MAVDNQATEDAKPKLRERARETRKSVLIIDKIADWTITVGGLLVIVAVFGIMVFLAQVVVPLFTGGSVTAQFSRELGGSSDVLLASTDEYHTLVLIVGPDGRVSATHIKTGQTIAVPGFDFGGKKVTAVGRTVTWQDIAVGFEDGTVCFGKLSLVTTILPPDGIPAGLTVLNERDRSDGQAIYSALPGNQFRKITVATELGAPQVVSEAGRPIVAIDYHVGGTTERPVRTFVAADADGAVQIGNIESRTNIMTGAVRTSVQSARLPPLPANTPIFKAVTTEKADQVYIAEANGTVHRFDTRDFKAPRLVETIDLVPGDGTLTAFQFLIGDQSLVAGNSSGAVDIYFRLQRPSARSSDGYTLVRAHQLSPHAGSVVAVSPSQRGKMLLTADDKRHIWLRHATSEQVSLKLGIGGTGGYRAVLLAPREDAVIAIDERGNATLWEIAVPHPETTLSSIYGKVWYEGYDAPVYTWQSSSGTDSFEPKLSLVPLIFGTIKATIYALLFAVPIALLAAIYTSEFVHPTVRATVKPVMEMMASLPSVVLGFIAALILAPIVETWIAAVLMAFVGVPLSMLLGAYLWQLLPSDRAIQWQGLPKFFFMFVVLGAGLYACYAAGGLFEDIFFAGDVKAWANGDVGSGTGFLFLLLLPVSFVLVMLAAQSLLGEWLQQVERRPASVNIGAFDFARWLAYLAAACMVSYVLALLVHAVGGDPRGGIVGTYVQRNTLVVGFAMAFAVIPIIYTISEDALNSVPEHLRAASLACGATPWQTAVRVILPTAASGVFAAVMIGMGRAVGETMIVVMAAGNTPILDWNLFNGLRALSANIAVELPEAVKDGTLYRMLFLAALNLFVMTFVVNTVAEIVRQRFRKRAVQL